MDLDKERPVGAARTRKFPGWLIVVAIVGFVLIASFIALHLAGGGMGGHGF
jgi:hypothetical protein